MPPGITRRYTSTPLDSAPDLTCVDDIGRDATDS
jgi:hypothetical protein